MGENGPDLGNRALLKQMEPLPLSRPHLSLVEPLGRRFPEPEEHCDESGFSE